MKTTKVRSAVAPVRLRLCWVFAFAAGALTLSHAHFLNGTPKIARHRPLRHVHVAYSDRFVDLVLRTVLAPYGDLVDEHWRHLAQHSVSWDSERKHFKMLCDPLIAKAFRNAWFYPLDLWKYWDAIKAPTLVLHGAKSDLLSRELTLEMRKLTRAPKSSSLIIAGTCRP